MKNVLIDVFCLPCTRGLALSVVFEASYRCQNNELLTRGLQRTTQVKSFWRPSTAAGVHLACQLCVWFYWLGPWFDMATSRPCDQIDAAHGWLRRWTEAWVSVVCETNRSAHSLAEIPLSSCNVPAAENTSAAWQEMLSSNCTQIKKIMSSSQKVLLIFRVLFDANNTHLYWFKPSFLIL